MANAHSEVHWTNTLPTLHSESNIDAQIDDTAAAPLKRGIVSSNRIRAVITQKDVLIAYSALTLIALASAFAQYTETTFTAYATSAFKSHSQLAAAGVVSRVFSMVAWAFMAKFTDNIGRISPLVFAVMTFANTISDAMMAGCKNVHTYIGANVFNGFGGTAYEMATQIYIAETTSIVSRAFWNVALDSISSIITMYSGAEIGGRILSQWGVLSGWRWGYGMWCIIRVVCGVPFIAILISWQGRVKQTPDLEPLPPRQGVCDQIFHEYDAVGTALLVAAIALILVPLTFAKGVASAWGASNIAMICVGFVLLLLFIVWSLPDKHRPSWLFSPRLPLIPWRTLRNRSVLAMFVINLCDFLSYGVFTIYFQSYMQVAVRSSPAQAAQIDNTLRIVFQVTALVIGALMRFWTPLCRACGLGERRFHTKYPICIGVVLCAIGIAIDIDFVQHPRRSTSVASFVMAKFLYGVGRGLTQTSAQVTIQAAAKRSELAIATGIFYLSMSLGGAIGVAVAGATWNSTLPSALAANLPEGSKNLAQTIYGSIAVAIKYDPDSPIGIAILNSYMHTMKILAIVATCMQIPMLIAMWFVEDLALTKEEQVVFGGKRIAMEKQNKGGEPQPSVHHTPDEEKDMQLRSH